MAHYDKRLRPCRKQRTYADSISSAEALLMRPLQMLQEVLCKSALYGHYEVVRYLLQLGVPPPSYDLNGLDNQGTILYEAIRNGYTIEDPRRDIATLLYVFGAPFYSRARLHDELLTDWDDRLQAENLYRVMTSIHNYEDDLEPPGPLLTEWLTNLPPRNTEVVSHRFLPEYGTTMLLPQLSPNLGASVATSLPPRPPPPKCACGLPLGVLDDFRQGVRGLRCTWAKHSAPHHWRTLRRWVEMRVVAFYWLGCTLERVCAPGGRLRAADQRAFRREFDWRPVSKRRMLDDDFTEDETERSALRLYRYHSPPPVYLPTSPPSPPAPPNTPIYSPDTDAVFSLEILTPVSSPIWF